MSRKQSVDLANLPKEEKLKYEIAEELGLAGSGDGTGVEILVIKRDRKNRTGAIDKETKRTKRIFKSNKIITNIK